MANTVPIAVREEEQDFLSEGESCTGIDDAGSAFLRDVLLETRSVAAVDGYSLDEHEDWDAIRSQGGMA
jgi:hypothetical protein